MRKLLVLLSITLTALFLSPAFAMPSSGSPFPVTYGDWSFKTVITVTGIPGISPRTLHFDDCLTAHHLVPSKIMKNCSRSPLSIAGRTLSYTLTCTSSVSKANITYGKRHLNGVILTTINGPNAPKVEERISGQYTGPCNKS